MSDLIPSTEAIVRASLKRGEISNLSAWEAVEKEVKQRVRNLIAFEVKKAGEGAKAILVTPIIMDAVVYANRVSASATVSIVKADGTLHEIMCHPSPPFVFDDPEEEAEYNRMVEEAKG